MKTTRDAADALGRMWSPAQQAEIYNVLVQRALAGAVEAIGEVYADFELDDPADYWALSVLMMRALAESAQDGLAWKVAEAEEDGWSRNALAVLTGAGQSNRWNARFPQTDEIRAARRRVQETGEDETIRIGRSKVTLTPIDPEMLDTTE